MSSVLRRVFRVFLSVWTGEKIGLPLYSGGKYDFTVEWGDGTSDRISAWDQVESVHKYKEGGEHEVRISGKCDGFNFDLAKSSFEDRKALVSIENWGSVCIGSASGCFIGCENLKNVDVPDLEALTDASFMFQGAASFNGDVSGWNTAGITTMRYMFQGASSFNGDVSRWDTSAVRDMGYMFQAATHFNGDVSDWNVASVTDMSFMFAGATAFDGDITTWKTESVTNVKGIFYNSRSFSRKWLDFMYYSDGISNFPGRRFLISRNNRN